MSDNIRDNSHTEERVNELVMKWMDEMHIKSYLIIVLMISSSGFVPQIHIIINVWIGISTEGVVPQKKFQRNTFIANTIIMKI